MGDDELEAIYTLYDPSHAEIVRLALEGEGIRCALENEGQAAMTGVFPIRVLVRRGDAERALEVIRSHEPEESPDAQADEGQ